MRCNAKPYQDKEPYFFVSYCHKDSHRVFPIIERLARKGFRLWYDEGIQAGSEWPEIIAEHLYSADACVIFLSNEYAQSHNCRKETNYAIMKKIPVIAVYLEETHLSPGMELQLGLIQYVMEQNDYGVDEICEKLGDSELLKECLGEPDLSISLQDYENFVEESADLSEEKKEKWIDRWFKEKVRKREKKSEISSDNLEVEIPKKSNMDDDPVTVLMGSSEDDIETVAVESLNVYFYRCSTGEKIKLAEGLSKIGRSSEKCSLCIDGNIKIGREHAEVRVIGGHCFIKDLYSSNHTYVNKEKIQEEKIMELHSGDEVMLADEVFEVIIEEGMEDNQNRFYLVDSGSGDRIEIEKEYFSVGRSDTKSDFVIKNNPKIGRCHAVFSIDRKKSRVCVADQDSKNGTYVNGEKICSGKEIWLKDGDEIMFADQVFIFHVS